MPRGSFAEEPSAAAPGAAAAAAGRGRGGGRARYRQQRGYDVSMGRGRLIGGRRRLWARAGGWAGRAGGCSSTIRVQRPKGKAPAGAGAAGAGRRRRRGGGRRRPGGVRSRLLPRRQAQRSGMAGVHMSGLCIGQGILGGQFHYRLPCEAWQGRENGLASEAVLPGRRRVFTRLSFGKAGRVRAWRGETTSRISRATRKVYLPGKRDRTGGAAAAGRKSRNRRILLKHGPSLLPTK